jgi:hypothetical protein
MNNLSKQSRGLAATAKIGRCEWITLSGDASPRTKMPFVSGKEASSLQTERLNHSNRKTEYVSIEDNRQVPSPIQFVSRESMEGGTVSYCPVSAPRQSLSSWPLSPPRLSTVAGNKGTMPLIKALGLSRKSRRGGRFFGSNWHRMVRFPKG